MFYFVFIHIDTLFSPFFFKLFRNFCTFTILTQTSNPIYGLGAKDDHSPNLYEQTSPDSVYEAPSSKEFDPSKLKLGRVLGQGEFGLVYEGLVRSYVFTCAHSGVYICMYVCELCMYVIACI